MISDAYFEKLAQIESGGNPKAKNPKSTAKGLYQFIDSTAKQYGLDDPYDPVKSKEAVKQFTLDNYNKLSSELGRDPTEGELYLAHQQGPNGALRLLKNPNKRAAELVGTKQIKLNAGSDDMTAADFASKWTSKFDMSGGEGQSTMQGNPGADMLPEGFRPMEQEESLPEGFRPYNEQAEKPSKLKSFGIGASQTATMGLGDEALSAIQALSPNQTYEQALQGNRQNIVEARQNPISYGLGEVAGVIPTAIAGAGLVPAKLAATAATMPLRAAATGGISGAVYGFGTGEGSGQERLRQAGTSGVIGAAVGPAGSYVGGKLGPLASRAMGLFKKPTQAVQAPLTELVEQAQSKIPATTYSTLSADNKALNLVENAIKNDFPDNWQQVLTAWKESDIPLAELYGSNTTSLAKGSAQFPSGQAKAEKYFDAKIGGSAERAVKAIPASVDEFYITADDLLAKGQAKAAPLYEKANAQMVQPTAIFQAPEVQSAIASARKAYPSELDALPDNSVKVLDYAKRVLDDQIGAAQRSGEKNFARARTLIKDQLLQEIDNQVPDYKQARAVAGDYLSVNKAMDDGLDFLKASSDAELIAKKLAKMTDKEKEAYKIGVGKSIRSAIENKSEGVNPFNAVMGSPEKQKRLMKVYTPDELHQLQRGLKAEDKLFKMRNQVLGGSPTTGKAIAAAQIAAGGEEALSALATGNIKGAGLSVIKSNVAKAFSGLNDKTAEAVSKLIYETDPVKKLALIEKMTNNKSFSEAEKQAVKQVYFTAQNLIKPKVAGSASAAVLASPGVNINVSPAPPRNEQERAIMEQGF